MADHHDRPFPGVTPFLTIREGRGEEAIAFYTEAFGAEVPSKNMAQDTKRVMQAELRLNGGAIMLSDEFPEFMGGPQAPAAGVTLHLQVDDADRWFQRATDAGAQVKMPLADQFWGDRYGQLTDPFGHSWSIGAPIKR